MRFIVIVKGNEQSDSGAMPDKAMIEKMEDFNEQLEREGALRAAEGLRPTSEGARIEFGGDEPEVTRGPFQPRDLVAGFWIIEAQSLDAAIEMMERAPFPEGEIEIRALHEDEDFAFAPEIVKREKAMRERLAHRPS